MLICHTDVLVENEVSRAKVFGNGLCKGLSNLNIFHILDPDVYGSAGVMGGSFAVLVGIVSASDYRAIIVVFENLVIGGDHYVYGSVQFGA